MGRLLEKMFIIEGLLFAILGILFISNPINSLLMLTDATGLILISIGILYMIRGSRNIWMGILNVILGAGLISMPAESVNLIITFYGAWSVVRGIYILVEAFRNDIDNNKFSIIYSAVIIILGLMILLNPVISFISAPYIIGSYFIISGLCELYLGFKIR